jgi:hypothetical protein
MENAREVSESKAFRWLGHLSEEELLGGPRASASPMGALSFEPRPLPAPGPSPTSPPASADPPETKARWHFQRRDLVAIGAVMAAVWFALQGPEGLPFRSSEAAEPATATELVTTNLAVERQELRSLPRGTNAAEASRGNGSGGKGEEGGAGGGGGSGSKDKPKPPPDDTSTPPLLKVTVPGVGSVTLDQPNLPVETPDVPLSETLTLPDAGDLLPQTPTVTLP